MTSDIRTIARGDTSCILQMRRTVVRTDEQWRAVWAAHGGPGAEAPPVDFSARMVAAVFQGRQSSAGSETAIVGATVDGPILTLTVEERSSTQSGAATRSHLAPFHIVSIPRFDGDVRFEDAHGMADEVTQAAPVPDYGSTTRITPVARTAAAAPLPAGSASSTGLAPATAGALAYLAGPVSGALLLIVERTSREVRFHAWQALLGLGAIGLAALVCLGLAFAMLIVSPRGFSVMRWLAAGAAVAWVVLWAICLVQAYKGRLWKMPLAGAYAARWAER